MILFLLFLQNSKFALPSVIIKFDRASNKRYVDLIEGQWGVKSMRSCLVAYIKPFLREEGTTHLQNGET